MLPWGWLGPHPGWGEPRQSRLTHDEQQTEFTLWAIARSPLILGANLTKLDDFTRSLMTNQSILFMNQNVTYSHPVDDLASLGAGFENARVWRATINEPGARNYAEYFGFFNLDDKPVTLRASWKQLGLEGSKHLAQNRVERRRLQGIEGSERDLACAWQHGLRDSVSEGTNHAAARFSRRFGGGLDGAGRLASAQLRAMAKSWRRRRGRSWA